MTHSDTERENMRATDPSWRAGDGRRVMLTEILAQVSSEALQGQTLKEVLQRIVDCLTRQLPVAIASIILLNEEGTHFIEEVWSGSIDLKEADCGQSWPVTLGAAGRCARAGEAQLIADVGSDPDYVAGNIDVESEYLVPIRHRTRLHGVLNLESTRADFFTPEVCAMFDAVALQVAGAIHLARVVDELGHANRRLRELSMIDGLTSIANRRCFDLRLAEEWARHARDNRSIALLLVDVDSFKALNDAHGHLCGDECLRELARLCVGFASGAAELVARYGGEEFVLLLPDRNAQEACDLAERLRHRVETFVMEHPDVGALPQVTVSIGVCAMHPDASQPPEILVAAADRALYTAKANGRNRVVARMLK